MGKDWLLPTNAVERPRRQSPAQNDVPNLTYNLYGCAAYCQWEKILNLQLRMEVRWGRKDGMTLCNYTGRCHRGTTEYINNTKTKVKKTSEVAIGANGSCTRAPSERRLMRLHGYSETLWKFGSSSANRTTHTVKRNHLGKHSSV